MKNDTSNTIDLDSLLSDVAHWAPIQEMVQNTTSGINWDDILLEWSYRCPKGYPTVEDGKLVSAEEVRILNEVLKENGLKPMPLPEADSRYSSSMEAKILSSPAFTNLINVQKKLMYPPSGNKVTIFLYVAGVKDAERAALSDEIVKQFLKNTPKGLNNVAATTVERGRGKKSILITIDGYKYEFILKVSKETASDTDVKEGFSVLFGYYPDALGQLDGTNVKEAAAKLKKYLTNTQTNITGLPDSVATKMVEYLDRIIKSTSKKELKDYSGFLNQSISHGNTFETFFDKNPDFYIERGDLFNAIRKAGSRISGYPADKWCPGDVYFIKNGSESLIESVLQSTEGITKSSSDADRAAALSRLNGLFSSTYSYKVSDKTPIVAVSLKMAAAQAGKLKSGLESYTKVKTDYNLDKAELALDQKVYATRIKKLQQDILSYVSQEKNTKFTWQPFNVDKFLKDNPQPNKETLEILRFKYAAYKALYFICSKVAKKPTEVDTALLGLVSFGLGLVESKVGGVYVNPPFFKVIANADGSAMIKPQFFKPGAQVSLIPLSGTMKGQPEIVISDSPGFKGFVMDMVVSVGDDVYDISATFRPNGMTQLTIELQKAHLR
jgi:hypothetical protein